MGGNRQPPPSSSKVPCCCGNSPAGATRCFGHNYGHVARCGFCKPGRRRGAGGKRSLKRLGGSRNGSARADWLDVVRTARDSEREGILGTGLFELEIEHAEVEEVFAQQPAVPPPPRRLTVPIRGLEPKARRGSRQRHFAFACRCCRRI